ncbi:Tyrosine-protein kinase PR2 [Orchesella cincta]|uniref:non-specific protein-tyrosine kinase n=1 Tax=Orchesella cincta TaxID=48709 RepID=A0A1D2NJU1_ORCCI|nr:Tyrosine-protein kinase PR2 [Orchesella cincta]
MGSKWNGPGLYEFLIEAELQQYYNALKNDLKVQNVAQIKYVSEEDLQQIGMSKPEMRRLKKYYQKHFPTNVLAKMKKKLLSRGESSASVTSLSTSSSSVLNKSTRHVAPGRHIIQAESIVIHKTLGSGEFGTVQQGVWTSDDNERIQVAIKCLSQERMENNPVEFLKEAAIMHSVDHEHVVRLYGVVLDTAALMLVTELAPLRSLLECLKEPSMRPNLSVMTLSDFAVQICDGMQYLESKRLIHRDLAARNILVFSRNKVKISDFGLSRALGVGKDYYQTNFNVNLKLPIAWCAPECINFLRFTSASDVWAFGVTLWEMYSYGFQPWAALTGQQILDAIDEPNYQRLERPECCPYEIYFWVMLKCWQHEPQNRPTFSQLMTLLPECKPEQVQAIRDSETDIRDRREYLQFCAGDIVTVLDRKYVLALNKPLQFKRWESRYNRAWFLLQIRPSQTSDEASSLLWKGVLKDGKSGLFNPGHTVTYLGSSLPSVKQKTPSPFQRNDSRSSSMRKGRLSVDMISGPQGDLKHTGHVGPDGQFFGDLTFLGSKCWVPRQVVSPYKPEASSSSAIDTPSGSTSNSISTAASSSRTSSSTHVQSQSPCKSMSESVEIPVTDKTPLLLTAAQMNTDGNDHEYHEISDEENELVRERGGHHLRHRLEGGVSNPALSSKSQSPLESPRFEKSFDLGGPSLVDEVFGALQSDHADEAHNVKNELREMARTKKKFATVKPISSSDRKTLDHAISLANELASRSMLDLDRPGKHGHTNASMDDISSPRTPNSPNHRRKFSFILGSSRSERERRNYSQEAASIPDIQV